VCVVCVNRNLYDIRFPPTIPSVASPGIALVQCFSTAGPRAGSGPSSYRKKNLPGRCLTKVENHCSSEPYKEVLQVVPHSTHSPFPRSAYSRHSSTPPMSGLLVYNVRRGAPRQATMVEWGNRTSPPSKLIPTAHESSLVG
jgi:hypothetical protein